MKATIALVYIFNECISAHIGRPLLQLESTTTKRANACTEIYIVTRIAIGLIHSFQTLAWKSHWILDGISPRSAAQNALKVILDGRL